MRTGGSARARRARARARAPLMAGAMPRAHLLERARADRRRTQDLDEDDGSSHVAVHPRADVAAIIARQLEELRSQANTRIARRRVIQRLGAQRDKLQLKLGAQVMLVRTIDTRRGLVNGARAWSPAGGATGLPTVRFARRGGGRASGGLGTPGAHHRRGAPPELAWALSVHKSQGMTLDRVEVSLANASSAVRRTWRPPARGHSRPADHRRAAGVVRADAPKVAAFYRDMRVQIVSHRQRDRAAPGVWRF